MRNVVAVIVSALVTIGFCAVRVATTSVVPSDAMSRASPSHSAENGRVIAVECRSRWRRQSNTAAVRQGR